MLQCHAASLPRKVIPDEGGGGSVVEGVGDVGHAQGRVQEGQVGVARLGAEGRVHEARVPVALHGGHVGDSEIGLESQEGGVADCHLHG